jgi:TolB protein
MDNYAYATTSPVYVTIDGKRAFSKQDADYFKAWISRTIEITNQYPDWNSPAEKQDVMKKLRDALTYYEDLE